MNKNKIYKVTIIIFLLCGFILYFQFKDLTQAKELPNEKEEVFEEIIDNTYEEADDNELKYIKKLVNENINGIARLVNKENALESDYEPDDLVIPNVKNGRSYKLYVRECIVNDLETMFNDAKKEGMDLYLVSGYRSSEFQEKIYQNSLIHNGKEHTEKYIAKPNHSEHQTGLAVDISLKSINYKLIEEFKNTKEGEWLKENAYKYGFILRYKEDRVEDTGYSFEPWHFRYVGYEIAKYIYENDLILEDLYN